MSNTNVAPSPAKRGKGQNIIAVASGKGGVGKTFLAITLANALSNKERKVLLFDGDLGLANLDIQLGLMPQQDLGSVIAGRLTLNQAVLPFPQGGFDIIAGRSGSGGLANIPTSRLQMLNEDLALLAQAYDHVILDLGAGVERTVRQLTHNVGTCMVVATDEPTSLTDAYAFIKLTHMERPKLDIRIVINAANSTREGERDRKSTRLNSSHRCISYAVFCLKKKTKKNKTKQKKTKKHNIADTTRKHVASASQINK